VNEGLLPEIKTQKIEGLVDTLPEFSDPAPKIGQKTNFAELQENERRNRNPSYKGKPNVKAPWCQDCSCYHKPDQHITKKQYKVDFFSAYKNETQDDYHDEEAADHQTGGK